MKKSQVQDIYNQLHGRDEEWFKLSLINHITETISEFKVSGFRVRLKLAQFLGWSDEKLQDLDIVIEDYQHPFVKPE